MKIVQINAVYAHSSTGRTTKELHSALTKHNIDSYVFCTNCENEDEHIYTIGSKLDWKMHAFLSRLFGLQGYFSYRATQKLIRQLKAIKPDVVHLRNLHANYIHLPLLLRYLAANNVGTVVTLHDCWLFTGKCCYYIDSKCEKWKNKCGNCPEKSNWNKSWFFDFSRFMHRDKKRLFGNISKLTVVGVSDWITNEAKGSFFREGAQFRRIYNWIDLGQFAPSSAEVAGHEFTALAVAQRWSREKGLFDIQYVAKEMPEVCFQLIGRVPDDVVLPSNVIQLGEISDVNTLASYYRKADVFLSLSVQETFGKAVAEAISSGTPAIVYSNTAAPELVSEGCGYAVATGDLDEVIKKIRLIREVGKGAYTEQCRNKALQQFDMQKNIRQYIELYEQLSCK